MKLQNWIRQFYWPLFIVILAILFGCGGGGGGGDDSVTPAAVPLLQDGIFTICDFRAEKTGLVWNINSTVFDADIDGVETIYVDQDRDGDFTDDDADFTGDDDGAFVITGGPAGAFSEDENLIALVEPAADRLDLAFGLRAGTGMNLDTFDGTPAVPYIVTKLAVNTLTGVAHTYVIWATRTGGDIGAFLVVDSSNIPAITGVAVPFTYDVEDNGNIIFDDSHEEGKIAPDGSLFIASDSDPANDFETIMVGMKTSSGMGPASLQGEFIVTVTGRNLTTSDYIAARLLLTFDGAGFVHYEFLEGGIGDDFVMYTVSPKGILIMAIPSLGYQYGIVSSDGNIFTCVDTDDAAPGLIYLMMGIKKH